MSPSLNDLPDLCLLTVFQYLSLLELLRTIRLVNTRWSRVLLPKELNRRRSLVIGLFDLSRLQLDQYQSPLIEHVKRDDGLTPWSRLSRIDSRNVVPNRIQPEMITTLVDTLPRITSLNVRASIFDLSGLVQITRMIDHWREHLITLKLCLFQQDYCPETGAGIREYQKPQLRTQTVALFDTINRAPLLKHLSVGMVFFGFNDDDDLPEFTLPLTSLSQLSTICIQSNDLKQYLYRALVPYASANRALQIGIQHSVIEVEQLFRIDPAFCERFSYICDISLHGDGVLAHLNRLCAQFSSLVYLKIDTNQYAITKLGKCLSQLSQLAHLSTAVKAKPCVESVPEHQRELPPDQIVPVPSVRLLTVTLHISSHSATEHIHLPSLFPNVQVLSITSFTGSCTDCGFTCAHLGGGPFVGGEIPSDDQMRQCAQLARRPFRRFPRLHTIEIDANDARFLSDLKMKLITKDEL